MDKYRIYFYIVVFLIIKCVFGIDFSDLDIKERKWEEETKGTKLLYNSFTRMMYILL